MVPTYRKRGRTGAQRGTTQIIASNEMQRLVDLVGNM